LDAYHKHYNLIQKMDDWWEIREALQYAYQQTENVGILEKEPNRKNFLMSPAIFNAWYQPNLNSITFPYAAFNPPSYGYGYPKAYNYAGQGSTAGHELTHGFDDEGNIYEINKNKIQSVQFNGIGKLNPCYWDRCGWLDSKSASGFVEMAQCVVSQYSEQCCPLKSGNVRCASGERTQGENIADIGGPSNFNTCFCFVSTSASI
uniref:Peptidase_M13 domain-containing protein n=1 Tax=Gongylonema pulchrum TaxID=637853 RepID=A0A183EB62_9BILA